MTIQEVVRRTYRQFNDDDVLTYSASLAFHSVLALFPFLVFVVAVVTQAHVPGLFSHLLQWANSTLPPLAAHEVTTATRSIQQRTGNTGLISIGIAGAIWAASGGIRSAMRTLDRAYDVKHARSAWRRILLSIAYTIAFAATLLVVAVLLFLGPSLVEQAASSAGLADTWVVVWRWLRFPAAALLLEIAASLFYTLLPRLDRVRAFTPGACLAVPLWLVAAWLFRLYATRVTHFGRVYGSADAFIVLLLYAWICATVLLIGAELNGVLHRGQSA